MTVLQINLSMTATISSLNRILVVGWPWKPLKCCEHTIKCEYSRFWCFSKVETKTVGYRQTIGARSSNNTNCPMVFCCCNDESMILTLFVLLKELEGAHMCRGSQCHIKLSLLCWEDRLLLLLLLDSVLLCIFLNQMLYFLTCGVHMLW